MALQRHGDGNGCAPAGHAIAIPNQGCQKPLALILGQPARTLINCLDSGSERVDKTGLSVI
jgi:hypothetical protein